MIDIYLVNHDTCEASWHTFDGFEGAARYVAELAGLHVTPLKQTVYKIRNKKDGRFKVGGMYDCWTKDGKSWYKPGHVKHHLNMSKDFRTGVYHAKVDQWEVVVYASTGITVHEVRDFHPES